MKTILLLLIIGLCGCASNPVLTQAIVQETVTSGVELGILKSTNAIPYIRAVTPVVCAAAAGTNVAPGEVVAALEASNAKEFKTPEGVLIVNSVLAFYNTVWAAVGTNAAAARPYLQSVCNGLQAGLPSTARTARRKVVPPHVE